MPEKPSTQEIVDIRYKMIIAIAFLIVGILAAAVILWFVFKKWEP